jgi:hypothetical protein
MFKLLFGPGTSKVARESRPSCSSSLLDLGAEVEGRALEFQAYLDTINEEPFDYDLFVLAGRRRQPVL